MARYLNDLDVNSSADNADVLLIEQSGVDKKITLNDIKDFVLESVFPIGSIYTQLPSQAIPSALSYPGTWTDISSSYAGDFFRVDGGDASAFESGQQADDNKSHTHNLNHSQSVGGGGIGTSSPGNTGYTLSGIVASSGGTEARPVNQTIRIWKRTA